MAGYNWLGKRAVRHRGEHEAIEWLLSKARQSHRVARTLESCHFRKMHARNGNTRLDALEHLVAYRLRALRLACTAIVLSSSSAKNSIYLGKSHRDARAWCRSCDAKGDKGMNMVYKMEDVQLSTLQWQVLWFNPGPLPPPQLLLSHLSTAPLVSSSVHC